MGHPTPASADPSGTWFTFERGVTTALGGDGWADVWKKEFFGWEYEGLAAYSLATDVSDECLLSFLLTLNLERAGASPLISPQ